MYDDISIFVGLFSFILGIFVLVKFFQIASDLKKIRSEVQEKLSVIDSEGMTTLMVYRLIPPNGIFIKKNPISGYFIVCLKEHHDDWKVLKTFVKYQDAEEFASSSVKEVVTSIAKEKLNKSKDFGL